MADVIVFVVLGGLAVLMYFMFTGKISLPFGEELDSTIKQEFGFLTAIKPALISCPNGYARPKGYRYNNAGTLDIICVDGVIIPNVNPDTDLPTVSGTQLLELMMGNTTVPVPIMMGSGEHKQWNDFILPHGSDHNRVLKDSLDISESRYQNMKHSGLNVSDGVAYFRELENLSKNMGKVGRNIVREPASDREIGIRRMPYEEDRGMSEVPG